MIDAPAPHDPDIALGMECALPYLSAPAALAEARAGQDQPVPLQPLFRMLLTPIALSYNAHHP